MVNAIWQSSVKAFVGMVERNLDNFIKELKNNFLESCGESPGIEQVRAWRSSLKAMADILSDTYFENLQILLEYRLPFSGERCDVILLGYGKNGKPQALIIELKGWNKADEVESNFVESDIGKSAHPEYQVRNYVGKIKFSHSASENFDIEGCVYMYNISSIDKNIDFNEVKGFFKDWDEEFRESLRETFDKNELPRDVVSKFVDGKYVQSKHLFDAIRTHYDELKNGAFQALADSGFGLSNEQLGLTNEILEDLAAGNKNVYLIQGAPGSGKSLLAIHILLNSLSRGKSSVLGYRNNRLINTIREVFDAAGEMSSVIKFYSTGRPQNPGLAEGNPNSPKFDIAIYDEAQRMKRDNMKIAMQRAPMTVFFYDEGQILNAEEEGKTSNFEREADALGLNIKKRYLNGFYRVQGGEQYHQWIETILSSPDNVRNSKDPGWNYEFRVFSSLAELINALKMKHKTKPELKVGLIASFTESPGDLHNPRGIKNLRVGYPLYSKFELYKDFGSKIYWLMDPRKEYVPFWMQGRSNELDTCASIYGCQGFELDYAGIIWGRDFVMRNNSWALGDNCEDIIGRPISLKDLIKTGKKGDNDARELSLSLLKNRYRIFLTRGISGTYIYCEDKETLEFLSRLI
ncbi:MAG: DNA/RNA helicase domain-containing protein [Candidatus Thermoplasmatota archaeon]|nr:DNA/RNA helicase domain-containing protein [Candidatus Thermoplasmatota archaeon]